MGVIRNLWRIVGSVIGVGIGLTVVALTLTHGNLLNWKNGLWRLFGYEPMTTYHTFVVNSPDSTVKSKMTEWMDPNNDTIVHVEVEHLNGDRRKSSGNMSVSKYKELWERVKGYIEPGTDREDYR